jgi:acetylornithine deacetylase
MKENSAPDVFGLLRSLIAIPSITGAEGPLADFLAGRLLGAGWTVKQQIVNGDRRNVFASDGARTKVVFCTHLDTVPGESLSGEDERFIYGRGSCDAKGSMAAMIAAAALLKADGPVGVGLLFVAGEETDSLGARLANDLGIDSDFVIVGEPTDNRLGVGHKGTVFVRLAARGKRAHSALPHLGESAVEKLLDVLADVRGLRFGEDPQLGPTLLNIGQIQGGTAANVVADEAEALLAIRPSVSVADVLTRLAEVAAGRAEMEVLTASEPQRLWTLLGIPTAVFPFGTDIPYLTAFGKPLLYGPGSAVWAHAADERIEKAQLSEAVDGYRSLARRLLAGEAVLGAPEGHRP